MGKGDGDKSRIKLNSNVKKIYKRTHCRKKQSWIYEKVKCNGGRLTVLGLYKKQWYKKDDKNLWNIEQWKIYYLTKFQLITRYSSRWNIPIWWTILPYIMCDQITFSLMKTLQRHKICMHSQSSHLTES